MNRLIANVVMSYIIVSVDFIGGFKTNFNISNWTTKEVIVFVVVLLSMSVMDVLIKKYKKK